jgi:hypothetical protein
MPATDYFFFVTAFFGGAVMSFAASPVMMP